MSRVGSSPVQLRRESVAASKSVQTSTSVQDIQRSLLDIKTQLAALDASLDTAIDSHSDLIRQIARLDLSRARLGSLSNVARGLQKSQLAPAASTAAKISAAVNALDTEQSRVRATLAVVEQVSTLRSCILGCVGSMGAPQDWETAASYLDRASEIPDKVVRSGFAEAVVPTTEAPDPPIITLENCRESLCKLFSREFEKATSEGDGGKVTRFFKMFPLIGKTEVGLDAYGRYVCQGVAARARERMQGAGTAAKGGKESGMIYAQAITKLFEHIAQVVDGHSPLVERHYGQGTMIRVIERLHREVDVQGGIILDTWYDERGIERRLTEVKSYAFTFLVQSFLNVQRGGTNTPRSASPAPGKRGPTQELNEDGVDMREVDTIIHEAATMLSHWSLYLRFISSRASSITQEDAERNDTPLTIPAFLAESSMPRKVQKILTDSFSTFSTFFLRRSVEKAFQLDESPQGLSLKSSRLTNRNPPYITSAVDDVMYIVDQVLQRSLATSQGSLATSVLSTIGRVLGSDFVGMIQRKMRDESYPKAVVQGATPPEDKIISFLVLINNLDLSADYIRRIVKRHVDDASVQNGANNHSSSSSIADLFPIGRDAIHVRNALSNLETTFASKSIELVNDGLAVAFSQLLKPRIRQLLTEALRDVDYSAMDNPRKSQDAPLDDEEDIDEEQHRSVALRFQNGWDDIISPMKRILSDRNNDRLMIVATTYVSGLLEKRIWGYQSRVSDIGAVKLEKDVAEIASVALKGSSFRLRESFARCTQIMTVANMDEEEWEDFSATSDIEIAQDGWVLNAQERGRARILVKGRD